MSFDLNTMPFGCDHYQKNEIMQISSDDLVTLVGTQYGTRMRGPVQGRTTVKVLFDGKYIDKDDPIYGWQVLDDELTIEPDKRSKIVFNRQLRLKDIIITVEYVTTAAYCLKCQGKNKQIDLKPSVSGSLKKVEDQNKLVQKIFKYILTSKCNFYPDLTCKMKDYIGRKLGSSLTEDDINFQITTALEKLRKIQQQQGQGQYITKLETLKDIKSINVKRSESNPSLVLVDLEVINYNNETSKVNFGIKVQ